MAEPDDKMGSGRWPEDWSTGWLSGIWVDAVGEPITGELEVRLSVERAASLSTHTTVFKGSRVVTLADGIPSGDLVTVNATGVPCIEFPVTDDPDILPSGLQILITESWSKITYARELRTENTLENPLWLSGDLVSIARQPGVIRTSVFTISAPPYVEPAEAMPGDLVVFKRNAGDLVEVFEVTE